MKLKLGMGTIITFLIVLAIGGMSVAQRMKGDAHPPVIERKVEVTTSHGIAPAPEFLLRHKKGLALTAAQEGEITRLAAAYRKDIAPLQRQADAAMKDYQQYMDRAQKGPRPDTQTLQAQGGDVQHLSSVMAATRQAYWKRAQGMLTETQRRQVDALMPQATLNDLR